VKSGRSTGSRRLRGGRIAMAAFASHYAYQSFRTTSVEDNSSVHLLAYYLLASPPAGSTRGSLGLPLLFLSRRTIPIQVLRIRSPFPIASSYTSKSTSLLLR
jgi:hypothetical protein